MSTLCLLALPELAVPRQEVGGFEIGICLSDMYYTKRLIPAYPPNYLPT